MKRGKSFIGEQLEIREGKKQKSLDSVLFSLDRLNREAEKKGVTLCIENRYYLHEIPSFDEIGSILNEFKGGQHQVLA